MVIYKYVSPNQFIIMSLDGKVYPMLIEETRLKPVKLWTTAGLVHYLSELKSGIRSGLKLKLKDLSSM